MGLKLFVRAFLIIGIMSIASNNVFAQNQEESSPVTTPEIMTKIKIPSHHYTGICREDSDCAVVELDCTSVGCSCEKGSVYKSLSKAYEATLNACRKQQADLKYCNKKCPKTTAHCVFNVCVAVED